jgi:hypothetical protein
MTGYPGSMKLELINRLDDSWPALADLLEIAPAERAHFPPGHEPRAIWEFLEARERLAELPDALRAIDRRDLAEVLENWQDGEKRGPSGAGLRKLGKVKGRRALAVGIVSALVIGGIGVALSHGGDSAGDYKVTIETNPDTMVTTPSISAAGGSYITQLPIERVPPPPRPADSCAGRYRWAHSAPLDAVDADLTILRIDISAIGGDVEINHAVVNEPQEQGEAKTTGNLLTCGGQGGNNQPHTLKIDLDTGARTFYPDGGDTPEALNLRIADHRTESIIVAAKTQTGLHRWNLTLYGDHGKAILIHPDGSTLGKPGRLTSNDYFATAGSLSATPYRFKGGKWTLGR